MSAEPILPDLALLLEPASVRLSPTESIVRRFAALTGDRSSLHVDDSFARRSAYRRPLVHGMLPLAFLPLLRPFRLQGHHCVPISLTGRFTAPVFADDPLVLATDGGRPREDASEVDFDYRIEHEGSGTIATAGTFTVRYDGPADPAALETGEAQPGLVQAPIPLRDYRLEQIEVGQTESLDFRVTPAVVGSLIALLEEGMLDPPDPVVVGVEQQVYLPNLLAMLLFSTSVGVCLPGASATFLEFSSRVVSPLEMNTGYVLQGRVTHRSRATTIVKKALSVVEQNGTGEPLLEGKVSALVNKPAGTMPTVSTLRETALDLGLRDKVVLITGASRGLGETTAKLFALSNSKVVVNFHRGGQDAERVVQEIVSAGGEAVAIPGDVTSPEEVRQLVSRSVDHYGTIDILVNNAARDYRPIPFLKLTWEDIQKDLDVIAKGAFLCCREVIPIMLARGGGKIVNISSLATEVPPPDQTKYVMAKSTLVGLTRSLAVEFASRNVQVNMVVPNFVETDFVAHVQEGFRKKIAEDIPMKRLASAHDVAQAVVFLSSAYASFTTGQKIMVTGGAAPLL
ncbi:MAG TPA: SDR family oxidoreductase [Longimicrobiales bacterium]|nr:SDR family oxidoreductase [Longimicrobiales bacterium]